jgi:hypothetical protein
MWVDLGDPGAQPAPDMRGTFSFIRPLLEPVRKKVSFSQTTIREDGTLGVDVD